VTDLTDTLSLIGKVSQCFDKAINLHAGGAERMFLQPDETHRGGRGEIRRDDFSHATYWLRCSAFFDASANEAIFLLGQHRNYPVDIQRMLATKVGVAFSRIRK
jgi:hypothetical protein